MIRAKLILVALTAIFSCAPDGQIDQSDNLEGSIVLKSANLEQSDIGMVHGTLFFVEDFKKWFAAYSKISEGLIISLRNVDDPSINLVFEGSKNADLAQSRVDILSSNPFLINCTAQGDPMSSYYKIEYYDKTPNPTKHYFAISFSDGETENWIEFVDGNHSYFEELGIIIAGIGTNPESTSDVYILFRQKDFVSFRKMLNSPRKIKRFLDRLSFPEDAMISYWIRTNEPA